MSASRFNRISWKLPILVVAASVVLGASITAILYPIVSSSARKAAASRLEAILEKNRSDVEDYLVQVENAVLDGAQRSSVSSALRSFKNALTDATPETRAAILRAYQEDNPFPFTKRAGLTDAGDRSAYTANHALYHPSMSNWLKRQGLADLLLVDRQGDVVYSVEKNADLGSNLLTGPHRGGGAAKAFVAALSTARPGQVAFVDFTEYGPANGAVAAFMAAPILADTDVPIGVLAVRIPIDRFNGIMTSTIGMGATGESYLVGTDLVMRSDSRFMRGVALTSTRFSENAKRAVAGERDQHLGIDYRQRETLAVAAPLDFLGTRWGIVVKQDIEEIDASVREIIKASVIGTMLITVLIGCLGVAFALGITRPLDRMISTMAALSTGDRAVTVPHRGRRDEIGNMASALEVFKGALIEADQLTQLAKDNEARLTTVLDSSPVGIAVSREDGTFLFVNDGLVTMFGTTRTALMASNAASFYLDPSDGETVVNRMRTEGSIREFAFQFRRADGMTGWALLNSRFGQFEGERAYFSWLFDVTEIKLAEAELKRIGFAMENAPEGVMWFDARGRIRQANAKAHEILGYEKGDLVGRRANALFRGIDDKVFQAVWGAVKTRTQDEPSEQTLIHADGGTLPIETLTKYISFGGQEYLCTYFRDITVRKQAETALQESGARLQRMLDTSPVCIAFSAKGTLHFANPRFVETFGAKVGDATPQLYVRQSDRDHLVELLERDGIAENREVQMYDAKQQVRDILTTWLSFSYEGEKGILVWLFDITERKAAEEAVKKAKEVAEEATKAKANFLATMSHEIRTPMNGVMSMAQILDQTRLTSEQKDLTKTIRQSAEALLTVINDILDFSKIEAGKLPIEQVEFDLMDVIEGVLDLLGPKAEEKSLKLLFDMDRGLPAKPIGDPGRVRQILLNLGSNAVKFTEAGRVACRVRVLDGAGDRTRLRFEIEDSGIGLTESQQAKLFQPFGQADSSTARRFGGTGLGLSICKTLCDLMGGAIGVESAVGVGSTFWFELPFLTADSPPLRPRVDLSSAKVLLIGYGSDEAETIQRMLAAGGVAEIGRMADIGEVTAEAFATLAPGLVLLDGRPGVPTVNQWTRALVAARPRQAAAVTAPHMAVSALRLTSSSVGNLDFLGTMVVPLHVRRLWDFVAAGHGLADRSILSEVSAETASYSAPTIEIARQHNAAVLVAEDNDTNQRVIAKILGRLGIAHEIAGNGAIALKMLEAAPYGLLLSDFHMPEMDGFELARNIRKRETVRDLKRLPIVALTADVLPGTEKLCIDAGMDGYLTKPINLSALEAAIRKWLPQAAALRMPVMASGGADSVVDPQAKHSAAPLARPGPNPAVFDTQQLIEAFGEVDGDAKEFLNEFLAAVPAMIGRTREELSGDRAKEARDAAHSLKGASRSMGAVRLGDIAARTQDFVDAGDLQAAKELMASLDGAYEEFKAEAAVLLS